MVLHEMNTPLLGQTVPVDNFELNWRPTETPIIREGVLETKMIGSINHVDY